MVSLVHRMSMNFRIQYIQKTLRDSWFLQSNVKNVFRVKRWTDETLDRLNFVKNSDNPSNNKIQTFRYFF